RLAQQRLGAEVRHGRPRARGPRLQGRLPAAQLELRQVGHVYGVDAAEARELLELRGQGGRVAGAELDAESHPGRVPVTSAGCRARARTGPCRAAAPAAPHTTSRP